MDFFAYPLTISLISELLGVPHLERERFRGWSTTIFNTDAASDEYHRAVANIKEYLTGLVETQRRDPGDTLLSDLIRSADEERGLSSDELHGTVFLLLAAGYETTANLIGNAVLALLRNPLQLAALRKDWSSVDKVVEESLRYDGPLKTTTWRFARENLEFGGASIQQGDLVLVALASANRDERRFHESDRFDIDRVDGNHLAFGYGIHYCVGAPLARLEAQVGLCALWQRLPDLALDVDESQLRWRTGMLVRGVEELPVRFSRPGDC
ncbi:cytochrome P450 [Nocardia arizonensis]|uniref:cytochrome P450 n=1 Tax=Nocardia arizonensis TaxID=1141647 RepID=UPI000AD54387|nr:cytochrome P450 [Nocardia arizonensis]